MAIIIYKCILTVGYRAWSEQQPGQAAVWRQIPSRRGSAYLESGSRGKQRYNTTLANPWVSHSQWYCFAFKILIEHLTTFPSKELRKPLWFKFQTEILIKTFTVLRMPREPHNGFFVGMKKGFTAWRDPMLSGPRESAEEKGDEGRNLPLSMAFNRTGLLPRESCL